MLCLNPIDIGDKLGVKSFRQNSFVEPKNTSKSPVKFRPQSNGVTTFIEVILNQELGEPFRRDAMKAPESVAGIDLADMQT